MNKKSFLCFLLTAAMLFSLAVCGSGAALAETPDIDAQLGLIQSKLDTLKQNSSRTTAAPGITRSQISTTTAAWSSSRRTSIRSTARQTSRSGRSARTAVR